VDPARLTAYLRERAGARIRILRLLPAAGPRLLAGAVTLQVFAGVVPVAFIVATSVVVGRVPAAVEGGLDSPAWDSLRNALLVASVLFLLLHVALAVQWTVSRAIEWAVDEAVRERVVAASFAPAGVAALEDAQTLDELGDIVDPLRSVGFSPGSACAGMLSLLARYLQWALAAALVGIFYAWWAGVATAVAALAIRLGIRSGLGRLAAFEASYAPARRRRDYYARLLHGAGPAKEVRLYGLLPWLQERYRLRALAAVRPVWRARRRIVYLPYAASLPLSVLLTGLASVGVARAAAAGDLTLGEMALALQAIVLAGTLTEFFFESDWQTEFGLRSFGAVERFERLVAAQRGPDGREDPRGRPRSEIRFEGVRFSYPGSPREVLRGLDLSIPAGRSLAIVGLNGAGKTTLVKVLARLYEPQAGRIVVDGIDAREFPAPAWQRRIGAIFQDFVHYDLPVADNVGFGAPELARDESRVRAALDRAGALELVETLPRGLATVLSREYEGGAELSGGQWQRIAIARALMAVDGGAGVLVLDEPTANLDVRAEAAFFDRFLELTEGLTTILISHRFSTVRRADRIVVLEEGRVVEDGTHEQLLARRGRYAQLFHLQAARFARGEDA
jgi:ATP-binding cassette, subfamily B, bacterial